MALTAELMSYITDHWATHPVTRDVLEQITKHENDALARCMNVCDSPDVSDVQLRVWLASAKAFRKVREIIENVDKSKPKG